MSATCYRLQTFNITFTISQVIVEVICTSSSLYYTTLLIGIEKGFFEEKVHLKAGNTVKITFRRMCTPSIRQNIYYYFVHSLHGVVVVPIIYTKLLYY